MLGSSQSLDPVVLSDLCRHLHTRNIHSNGSIHIHTNINKIFFKRPYCWRHQLWLRTEKSSEKWAGSLLLTGEVSPSWKALIQLPEKKSHHLSYLAVNPTVPTTGWERCVCWWNSGMVIREITNLFLIGLEVCSTGGTNACYCKPD